MAVFLKMTETTKSSCAPARQTPGTPINEDELALLCKAIAHPARVKLLKHLADYGNCYFGKLTDILPLAPSTVSNHVSILKDAGLIKGSSDEQRVCYCVNAERLSLLKQLINNL